ncbi:MAG: LysM peptidoglycan-binding domain-containing protein [Pseudomonadota bacterium]
MVFLCPVPARALVYKTYHVRQVHGYEVLCDIYTVRPGDNLSEIFRLRGQLVERAFPEYLRIFRKLNSQISDADVIYPGQGLLLPLKRIAPGTLPGQETGTVTLPMVAISSMGLDREAVRPPEPDEPFAAYQVRSGDTVSRILSQRYGQVGSTTYQAALGDFLRLNPLISDVNRIYPGEVLRLPETRESPLPREAPATVAKTPAEPPPREARAKQVPAAEAEPEPRAVQPPREEKTPERRPLAVKTTATPKPRELKDRAILDAPPPEPVKEVARKEVPAPEPVKEVIRKEAPAPEPVKEVIKKEAPAPEPVTQAAIEETPPEPIKEAAREVAGAKSAPKVPVQGRRFIRRRLEPAPPPVPGEEVKKEELPVPEPEPLVMAVAEEAPPEAIPEEVKAPEEPAAPVIPVEEAAPEEAETPEPPAPLTVKQPATRKPKAMPPLAQAKILPEARPVPEVSLPLVLPAEPPPPPPEPEPRAVAEDSAEEDLFPRVARLEELAPSPELPMEEPGPAPEEPPAPPKAPAPEPAPLAEFQSPPPEPMEEPVPHEAASPKARAPPPPPRHLLRRRNPARPGCIFRAS